MNGRRAIVGLCLLCAMAFSAIAAQSAMAAKGTTMFTCSSKAEKLDFGTADCNTAGSGFGHIEVAQDVTTHTKYVNTDIQKFKSTVAGTAFTLSSNNLTGTGSCFNRLNGKEHWIQCSDITLIYHEVTVSVVGGVCGVKSDPGGVAGTIETKALKATTQTEKMAIKLEPEVGTVLAAWEWTGSECPFSGTVQVVGSIECVPSGAELVCNHNEVTAAKSLRLGSGAGPLAGYEGHATITGGAKEPAAGEPTGPLSATTKETA